MPCVYTTPEGLCNGKAPLSKNEHYLPRALGNFKNNEPLVDRICDKCQSICSKLEDVFAHNPTFTGFEPEFDDIKQYIYAGKGDRPFVQPVDEPFLRDLQQKGARLNKWAHLLSAQSTETGIAARIQFFAGPEVNPIVWSIVFTEKPSQHIQATGYVFVYFDEAKDGYDGVRGDLIAV